MTKNQFLILKFNKGLILNQLNYSLMAQFEFWQKHPLNQQQYNLTKIKSQQI
jgi:hypothetical protein